MIFISAVAFYGDVFSTGMAMSTRELGEMGSTTVRLVDELYEACLQHFSL